MIGLLLVSLASAESRMGFMLQLYDPAGYLTGAPQVNLKGSEGSVRRLDPADDGNTPDIQASDHIYTSPVPSFADASVTIDITSGSRTWHAEVTIPEDEKALVRLRLDPDGSAMAIGDVVMARPSPITSAAPPVATGAPGAAAPTYGAPPSGMAPNGATGRTGPSAPTGTGSGAGSGPANNNGGGVGASAPRAASDSSDLGPGIMVWGAGFVSLGVAVGIIGALRGRRAGFMSRLGSDPVARQAPRRLDLRDVDAALDGPLAPYRVVVLGDPRPGTIPCEEAAPLPEELVSAIERLATTAGGPPALLVTDPSRLDRPHPGDPVEALAARVGGYFPLWVVGGPAGWARWQAPPPDPEGTASTGS